MDQLPTPGMRASDADRDHAAEQLREHYGAGRLTSDELSERAQAVYASRTRDELARLFTDLPGPPAPPRPLPEPAAHSWWNGVPAAMPRRMARGWMIAFIILMATHGARMNGPHAAHSVAYTLLIVAFAQFMVWSFIGHRLSRRASRRA